MQSALEIVQEYASKKKVVSVLLSPEGIRVLLGVLMYNEIHICKPSIVGIRRWDFTISSGR